MFLSFFLSFFFIFKKEFLFLLNNTFKCRHASFKRTICLASSIWGYNLPNSVAVTLSCAFYRAMGSDTHISLTEHEWCLLCNSQGSCAFTKGNSHPFLNKNEAIHQPLYLFQRALGRRCMLHGLCPHVRSKLIWIPFCQIWHWWPTVALWASKCDGFNPCPSLPFQFAYRQHSPTFKKNYCLTFHCAFTACLELRSETERISSLLSWPSSGIVLFGWVFDLKWDS